MIEYLDSPTSVPESQVVAHGRPKRFAAVALATGLAAFLSMVNMGVGISNSVDIRRLTETISYIQENQENITFKLNKITEAVLELTTEHHNSFLAIKQKIDLVKLQSDFNACQIGLNRIDNLIESILSQSLTNHILPPSDILAFLKASPVLRDSLYVRFPRLAYQLGKIELVNVDPERKIFTVLVILPHISSNPDGFLYEPLFAPRFFTKDNHTLMENIPDITSLFSYNGPFENQQELMSIDRSKCTHYNLAMICPLTAQFHSPGTACTNRLINNDTDEFTLTTTCGSTSHVVSRPHLTNFAESSTSLLLFTNEHVTGTSSQGDIEIVPPHAPLSCVAVQKLLLSSLSVGGKKIFLNLWTDAFSIAPSDRSVIKHLHALRSTLAHLRDPIKLVGHLHPSSSFFLPSAAAVAVISTAILGLIGASMLVARIIRRYYHRYRGNQRQWAKFQRDFDMREVAAGKMIRNVAPTVATAPGDPEIAPTAPTVVPMIVSQ